jgi:hypothetical protein
MSQRDAEILSAVQAILAAIETEMAGYPNGMTAGEVTALRGRLKAAACLVQGFQEWVSPRNPQQFPELHAVWRSHSS